MIIFVGIIGVVIGLMVAVAIIDTASQLKRIANALEAQNTAIGVNQAQYGYAQPIDNPSQHKMPGESWADFKARTGRN